MKTGYTEAAGYCLVASARRGDRRLLSVLLGSTSEAVRAQESQKLLNWGFQFFDSVQLYERRQRGDDRSRSGKARRTRSRSASARDLFVTRAARARPTS